jgi:hypothetical protein
LTNTNETPIECFSSVDCDEFYRWNYPSLYPSVNTNRNISLIYTDGIAVRKRKNKKARKV